MASNVDWTFEWVDRQKNKVSIWQQSVSSARQLPVAERKQLDASYVDSASHWLWSTRMISEQTFLWMVSSIPKVRIYFPRSLLVYAKYGINCFYVNDSGLWRGFWDRFNDFSTTLPSDEVLGPWNGSFSFKYVLNEVLSSLNLLSQYTSRW